MTGAKIKRRLHGLLLFISVPVAAICIITAYAYATGTPAGTQLTNTAVVNYIMGGVKFSTNVSITLSVDDKVNFTLTASNISDVPVSPGGGAYETYVLSNAGNGPHDFTLNAAILSGNTFAPSSARFYSDAAATTPLPTDPTVNLQYISSLAQDKSVTVYLDINAPASSTNGQILNYNITATAYQNANLGNPNPVKSSTVAAADASINKNTNLNTVLVVLADGHGNGGDANRDGMYSVIATDGFGNRVGFDVQSSSVNVVKTETVADQYGGSQPVPGATIHYTLSVSNSGSATALNVIITDLIPANTTYISGTLKLNNTVLPAGSTVGDVGVTTPGTVTVKLGNLTTASQTQTIMFDVMIN